MKTKSMEERFDMACANGLIKTHPKFEVNVVGIKKFINQELSQARREGRRETIIETWDRWLEAKLSLKKTRAEQDNDFECWLQKLFRSVTQLKLKRKQ